MRLLIKGLRWSLFVLFGSLLCGTTAMAENTAPVTVAPARVAPTKTAPVKAAPTSAPVTKAAPTKAAPTKAAPTKAAPTRAAPTRAAPTKTEPTAKVAPAVKAPTLKVAPEKVEEPMVRRGIYDRPYLFRAGSMLAVGGYVDVLGGYMSQDGVSDGFSFEARRFNLFVFSSISRFIRLTAELEFEHGTGEIALETALVDVRLHSMLNLRGGIILVPLGRFNITHDSPIYDIIDRPLVSTRIIPSTYSDVGGGVYGSFYFGRSHKLTYEAYVINGLTSGIISASPEGTRIEKGKTAAIFEEDQNGVPALTGRIGYTLPFGLELGVSMYAGIYNHYRVDGEDVDVARWLTIVAVDLEFSKGPVTVRAEAAWAWIDVPPDLRELNASFQWGVYADISVAVWKGRLLFMRDAALLLVTRFDFIDLNAGAYASTGQSIGDETYRVSAGISFRPVPQTSLRVIYQHNWLFDVFGNLARRGGIQLGLATYF